MTKPFFYLPKRILKITHGTLAWHIKREIVQCLQGRIVAGLRVRNMNLSLIFLE